jgi:methylase of polypeptide subunit release factors
MSSESPAHDRLNAELVELMRQQVGMGEQEVEVMGRTFIVLPEVFNVAIVQNILEYLTHAPLKIVSEELAMRGAQRVLDILEIGPGMGYFAVCAASLGPHVHVTAVDINPAAVENVNRNAARHGVQERVTCAVGDVYEAPVTVGKTFDVIFWDPPFSRGALSLREHTQLERAVWDPGYEGLTQYISRAREFLKPAGRLLLGWNDFFGDGEFLAHIATKNGWHIKTYGEAHFPLGPSYQTFLSYELISHEKATICPTCGTFSIGPARSV